MPVEVDGKSMQQALVNLIDNAVKHSPKGSGITVGIDFMSKGNRIVHLWVEDKGEGIPASEHERIFERFYRLGSEVRRETQGVGIGLSIVKHIVEAHGGKIIVRCARGQGQPVYDRIADQPTEGGSMSRILIVEDELAMRTALKECLEIEGHRVLTAADGEAGLKKALEEKPDLVLLDIMMPRLDGYAVCAELRRVGNGCARADADRVWGRRWMTV